MQVFLIAVHHLMVVGKQQYFLPAVQKRAHKLRHERRFGDTRCLTLTLLNLHFEHRSLRTGQLPVVSQLFQLLSDRLHELLVDSVV